MYSVAQPKRATDCVERLNIIDYRRGKYRENLRISMHVQIHKINYNEAYIMEMLLWVRSVRVFKSRSLKSKHQDM